MPFPHDRAAAALHVVGLDLDEALGEQHLLSRDVGLELGHVEASGHAFGVGLLLHHQHQDIAVREHLDVMVLELGGRVQVVGPDQLAVPVEFLDPAALAASRIHGRRADHAGVQEVAVLQEVDALAWRIGAVPLLDDLAFVVDEVVHLVLLGGEQGVAVHGLAVVHHQAHGPLGDGGVDDHALAEAAGAGGPGHREGGRADAVRRIGMGRGSPGSGATIPVGPRIRGGASSGRAREGGDLATQGVGEGSRHYGCGAVGRHRLAGRHGDTTGGREADRVGPGGGVDILGVLHKARSLAIAEVPGPGDGQVRGRVREGHHASGHDGGGGSCEVRGSGRSRTGAVGPHDAEAHVAAVGGYWNGEELVRCRAAIGYAAMARHHARGGGEAVVPVPPTHASVGLAVRHGLTRSGADGILGGVRLQRIGGEVGLVGVGGIPVVVQLPDIARDIEKAEGVGPVARLVCGGGPGPVEIGLLPKGPVVEAHGRGPGIGGWIRELVWVPGARPVGPVGVFVITPGVIGIGRGTATCGEFPFRLRGQAVATLREVADQRGEVVTGRQARLDAQPVAVAFGAQEGDAHHRMLSPAVLDGEGAGPVEADAVGHRGFPGLVGVAVEVGIDGGAALGVDHVAALLDEPLGQGTVQVVAILLASGGGGRHEHGTDAHRM